MPRALVRGSQCQRSPGSPSPPAGGESPGGEATLSITILGVNPSIHAPKNYFSLQFQWVREQWGNRENLTLICFALYSLVRYRSYIGK